MEEKSAVIERFMRTLKNKIYKYMNSILKTCILINQMINKHNNAYHRTNKMKPIDVKDKTYINSIKEFNDLKIKFDDHVRISKYKTFLEKVALQKDLKKFL